MCAAKGTKGGECLLTFGSENFSSKEEHSGGIKSPKSASGLAAWDKMRTNARPIFIALIIGIIFIVR